MRLEQTLFGKAIFCEWHRLDDGIEALVAGGDRSHVGAVSICDPGETPRTTVFPGHKDQFISEPWAEKLAAAGECRACVVCGIHYDNASKEQITDILRVTDAFLDTILRNI